MSFSTIMAIFWCLEIITLKISNMSVLMFATFTKHKASWCTNSIHFQSGSGYYPLASGSGFYQTSPGLDSIYFESGSELYQGSPGYGSGSRFNFILNPGPDFIRHVRVQVCPGLDFTNALCY